MRHSANPPALIVLFEAFNHYSTVARFHPAKLTD
jgi:hypothetical protein